MKNDSNNLPIIFITGASRSGTTMLNRILGRHESILGLKELHYFGDLCKIDELNTNIDKKDLLSLGSVLFSRLNCGVWNSRPNNEHIENASDVISSLSKDNQTYGHLFSSVIQKYLKDSGKAIACEQTPRNIFYANRLLKTYPNSYIVNMSRDPRGVLASQKKRWRQRGMGKASIIPFFQSLRVKINYHPYSIAKLWHRSYKAALQIENNPRFINLKFEDVVNNPDEEIRGLCEFLGVKFEPSMLNVPIKGSSHRFNQDKVGISKEGVNRWEGILSMGEIDICEHLNGIFMEELGYKRSSKKLRVSSSLISSFLYYPFHVAGVFAINPRRAVIQLRAMLMH